MSSKGQVDIKVDGEASLLLPPERAILNITIRVTSTVKSDATAGTIESTRKVEAYLRQLAGKSSTTATKLPDIDYWSRTSLTESQISPYSRTGEQKPAEHTAKVDFRIQLQTFRKLGSLIHDLVAIPHVASNGVTWELTPATQAAQRSKLRIMAAENAVTKAKDYANALGYGNVYPVELVGAKQHTHMSTMKATYSKEIPDTAMSTKASNMAVEEGEWEDVPDEEFQYAAGEVELTQSCSVSFRAE
ncbi:hypothetical protein MMC10_006369 [Thelotrema lepadinum]|nr:hypothetical protein [Thelotrema lepadinum]